MAHRSSTLALGVAALLGLALLVSPWSPSTQTSGFFLTLDLDPSEDNQAVASLDVSPDQVVAIQIFGSDIRTASGVSARFAYEPEEVVYEGFDAGDALPGAHVLVQQDSTSVRINVASLSGSASVNAGLVGTVRFRTIPAFTDTEIRLVRGELLRGGRTEILTPAIGVALQVAARPSPDFDGSGLVGFADFVLFAGAFGYRQGDEQYDVTYDLTGDGAVSFDDFVIFATSFGGRGEPLSGLRRHPSLHAYIGGEHPGRPAHRRSRLCHGCRRRFPHVPPARRECRQFLR